MKITLRNELIQYSNDVINGKIIACQKHKWACMRFLNDLKKENTDEFPYIFNEKNAKRFLLWVRLFRHRRGVLKGETIKPAIIHKFIFGNVYGWIHRKTKYRRFNKLYWQVARKNTKSQWLSLVASYELMAFHKSGNDAAEVYCAATKRDQAKIVYDETVEMLKQPTILKGKFRVAYGRIFHIKSGSVMRALSEEDKKTADGYNPQCGIIDEYHAHETAEVYDILDSGMGAREEPLLAIITTAGFEKNNPCYRIEYTLISKILDPDNPINLDSYFAMVNELDKGDDGKIIDDVKDPAVWEKANPIICSYEEGRSFLAKKLVEALEAPEKMTNFLTKHMNIWVDDIATKYMNMSKWVSCKADRPDLSNHFVYIGLDLSSKIDLTSVGFDIPFNDKYCIYGHSFIPEETLDKKKKTDKVPYELWINQGWISVTPGAVIDYRKVLEYIEAEIKKQNWKVAEWCIDPWGATQIATQLIDEGNTVVEIIQGIKTLSEPTKDFRDMAYSGRIIHDGDPCITWAIGNAVAEMVDRNQNLILSKKKSTQRIDPITSIINAHVRAILPQPVSGGVYFL
jgi:phage terminase large subunit-like protein